MIKASSFLIRPFGLFLALVLNACATQMGPEQSAQADAVSTQPLIGTSIRTPLTSAAPLSDSARPDPDRLNEAVTLFPGTGQFVNARAASKPAPVQKVNGEITLNFEGANIRDVIKVVFDALQENYIIDPQVQGEVTVQTSQPLPKDMLIPTLETLLRMNQAALLREGGVYKVVPLANAASSVAPQLSKARLGFGYAVRIVPLRYVSVAEMQKLIEPLVPQSAILRTDAARNMLIVGGTPQELIRIQETINIFDVNWLKGMSVGLYRLKNIDSQTVAAQLDSMFGEASKLPLAGLFRFVPINQLNAVLVITPQPEYLKEAGLWVERLDGSGGERLYVYRVQNGTADYLASILNAVFGSGGSPATASSAGQVAPGLQPVQLSGDSSGSSGGSGGFSGGSSGVMGSGISGGSSGLSGSSSGLSGGSLPQSRNATGSARGSGVKAAELGMGAEQVRIVPDTDNNALLIWADKHNQEKIIGALRKLDVARRQVLVEATIAEVTLTGALRYGLQWYFKNDVGNYTGYGSLNLRTNVPITTPLPSANVLGNGFAYAITDSAGFVRALLDTLASESKLKVLSAPNLMVSDNQEATIRVGTQQPISGPQTVTTGVITSSFQYKDTGVFLQVRPQINAGGLVTMDINQAVTDVGPIDAATGQRTFDQRTITSRVAVQSGQSIVLGGLIRDRQIDSDSGIPGLYKIPLLGALFGKTDNVSSRTELVVLITPKVVENSQDNQNIIDDLREKMKAVAPMVLGS